MPWEELPSWAQKNIAEYGKPKIVALVYHISDAFGYKRRVKDLLTQIDSDLAEFAM